MTTETLTARNAYLDELLEEYSIVTINGFVREAETPRYIVIEHAHGEGVWAYQSDSTDDLADALDCTDTESVTWAELFDLDTKHSYIAQTRTIEFAYHQSAEGIEPPKDGLRIPVSDDTITRADVKRIAEERTRIGNMPDDSDDADGDDDDTPGELTARVYAKQFGMPGEEHPLDRVDTMRVAATHYLDKSDDPGHGPDSDCETCRYHLANG